MSKEVYKLLIFVPRDNYSVYRRHYTHLDGAVGIWYTITLSLHHWLHHYTVFSPCVLFYMLRWSDWGFPLPALSCSGVTQATLSSRLAGTADVFFSRAAFPRHRALRAFAVCARRTTTVLVMLKELTVRPLIFLLRGPRCDQSRRNCILVLVYSLDSL